MASTVELRDKMSEGEVRGIYENSPQLKRRVKDLEKRCEAILDVKSSNGAGLELDKALREFFFEYNHRILSKGFDYLPSSINVLEAFFPFIEEAGIF